MMNKYSKDQLQQMATEALEARNAGDPRYQLLVMNMCMITGLQSGTVEYKIKELEKNGEVS